MLALTLDEAKTIGAVVVVALVGLAIAAAWVMKEVMQKVVLVVILGLLALLVWTQRASLDECADKVREGRLTGVDTTCSFFGLDVKINTARDS
jgi:protein-S-isoprenylcysteine O-methyltransferase Ste14